MRGRGGSLWCNRADHGRCSSAMISVSMYRMMDEARYVSSLEDADGISPSPHLPVQALQRIGVADVAADHPRPPWPGGGSL